MARIVGVDIPRNKKIIYSLCYIHGIGMATALQICNIAKVDTDKRNTKDPRFSGPPNTFTR